MKTIYYSNQTAVPSVVCIWGHGTRGNPYRAYWCASPDAEVGSPVIGYCSPGGEWRTIRECVAEVRRYFPGESCYRNGREVYRLEVVS